MGPHVHTKGLALNTVSRWMDENVRSLGRDIRWSFLPPLMVYMAAGVQGLTGIVGTFFVKEHLGLSAEFLAALAFWAGLPWALKMPIGHLVDVFWRYKSGFILLGASLIAASLLIMVGLVGQREAMASVWSVNSWFVLAALLSPIGYVLQDATADAMTVEAVPRCHADGTPLDAATVKRMHTTMQTLGRVAIVAGTIIVALINLGMFADVQTLSAAQKTDTYRKLYLMALVIPLLSVAGLVVARVQRQAQFKAHMARGLDCAQAAALLQVEDADTPANPVLLGGSLVFVALTIGLGLSGWRYSQELIFATSMIIIGALMARLVRELEPSARHTLLGTALVIFMYRAVPGPGAGVSWWMIDQLGFDQPFFSVLSLIGSTLALAGMFMFRRFMSDRSIFYVVGALTVLGTLLSLPTFGMSLGLHEWTAAHTGGVVDARFIAVVDTALESPLGQISMIPMLVWIANSAPAHLKATYFAVMASFTNLALSAAQLGTKYLNQLFTLTRQVRDASGAVTVPANYTDLSGLLLVVLLMGLLMPLAAIAFARWRAWGSA
jgi:BT1 family